MTDTSRLAAGKVSVRALLERACQQGELRLLDLHLGLFLEKQAGKGGKLPELLLAATLTSAAAGGGHVCWPLAEREALPFPLPPGLLPDAEHWRRSLLASGAVGQPGEMAPLILDQSNRLYLRRFHQAEERIARELLRRASATSPADAQAAQPLLQQLFPSQASGPDWQQAAAAMALLKPLLVISGGPGTGKTYTAARIIALLQSLHNGGRPLRAALAAPTGKAAARLDESIRAARQSLPEGLGRALPEQAQTLHRLLGARPGSEAFRHNRDNPLAVDLLLVDEASMIDLMLMAALLDALPPDARLILLGDRSQLASVEAGSLFADLCGSGEPAWSEPLRAQISQLTGQDFPHTADRSGPLADSCVLLRTGHRFQGESGIGSLAAAVNSGSVEAAETVLAAGLPDLEFAECAGREREAWLRTQLLRGFRDISEAASLEAAFAAMEQFRLLCAVHKGPNGTEGINSLAAAVLRQAGLISSRETEWHQGKPLIILRNQYDLQLFNGDTGLLWRDRDGRLKAWFRRADGRLHPVAPSLLPEHETAYAVTVHKAQGSEFEQVLLLLPEEESRVLSRELLYTGITRARSKLVLCADRETLAAAVRSRTKRHSGLAEKLGTATCRLDC
ncbi:exodeoxyribonuclease V subunit alpha [Candidatus Electronema sp. JC]|uniref:exodeoxyribonuclease V subunit alpha n=1 Tax=Candidatus Electronema sp. JC TaxID=3401570 RepID=UPI003AA8D8E2